MPLAMNATTSQTGDVVPPVTCTPKEPHDHQAKTCDPTDRGTAQEFECEGSRSLFVPLDLGAEGVALAPRERLAAILASNGGGDYRLDGSRLLLLEQFDGKLVTPPVFFNVFRRL